MTASNAVIIYDINTKEALSVIVCDNDSQITAMDGPVQAALDETKSCVLVPINQYEGGLSLEQIAAIIQTVYT